MAEEKSIATIVPEDKPERVYKQSAEQREKGAANQQRFRDRKVQDSSIRRWDSTTEVTTKQARVLLVDVWKLSNPRAITVIVELAETAAEHFHLKFNQFLFRQGLRATLASNAAKEPVERPGEIEDGPVVNELLSRHELWLIWNFSMFREPDLTFAQFLELRAKLKTDAFELGLVLEKDFHQCHKDWFDYFPKFTADLKPGYSQEDVKSWLKFQGR
jgi:hypothetical protein